MISSTEQRIRQNLEQARAEQGLTHAAIAQKLGIKPPSVTAILTRKRALVPQSLIDLLDALGLEIVVRPKQVD